MLNMRSLDIETKKKIIKNSGRFFLYLNASIFVVVIVVIVIKILNS